MAKKQLGYSSYAFLSHDPIIDRIAVLIRATGVKIKVLSEESGVSEPAIYKLLRTGEDRGMKKYHSKGMRFSTACALVIALGEVEILLPEAKPARRPRLRVVA